MLPARFQSAFKRSADSKMVFQRLQTSVLVFTVCLVLVITSAGNFKVSAAAQQFEAQTSEGTCPVTQDDTERVNSKILQDIGPLIEQLSDPLYMYTCNGTPGWRRVVFINMTDTSYDCPPGLNLTSYSKRTCGRAHSNYVDCSSTTFSVGGSEYSRVCGRIRGYQVGSTNAFWPYRLSHSIERLYVGGVSLTHGAVSRRQHIWTFASGLTELDNGQNTRSMCPCDTSNETVVSPWFVGNDYFCESGLHSPWSTIFYGRPFLDDPLWDGQNCTSTSTCCQFNNPPWFTKNLPRRTTDDIELRLCFHSRAPNVNTALELIELYVQ